MDEQSGATTGSSEVKRVVETGYDQVAHIYARLEDEEEWPRLRWLDKLLERLPAGSSRLDLGCGSGDPADIVIAQVHTITGVDISQEQIARARQNVPSGHFMHGDVASVEFPVSTFDAVVSFYALEHIPRDEHATLLARIQQWLRPEGYLLIGMEAREVDDQIGTWLDVPMYFSSFGPETVQELVVQAGFGILASAIEPQIEQGHKIDYLWILARKQPRMQ
jgi:cyclopropane fatty-acyl-phospholipid synthase-like methyltransferase